MKKILIILLVFPIVTFAQEVKLYNGKIPDATTNHIREISEHGSDDILRISKVSVPTITVFKAAKPNGRAVIICPGGGYGILAFDHEGTRVATELNKWGVTAFVLKYRLPDDSISSNKSFSPLQDAQEAIRFVRNHAKEYKLDTSKIGIMGFSAGGHLAATAATHFDFKAEQSNNDATSTRPDFAILIYPVISFDSNIMHAGSKNNLIGENASPDMVKFFSNELQVSGQTPPVFLIHSNDDDLVPVENSVRFYESCLKHHVQIEMHLYPNGKHGFGMNNPTTKDKWMDRLKNWLETLDKK